MTPHITPVDGPAVELTDALVLALREILGPLADLLPLDSLELRLERHHAPGNERFHHYGHLGFAKK